MSLFTAGCCSLKVGFWSRKEARAKLVLTCKPAEMIGKIPKLELQSLWCPKEGKPRIWNLSPKGTESNGIPKETIVVHLGPAFFPPTLIKKSENKAVTYFRLNTEMSIIHICCQSRYFKRIYHLFQPILSPPLKKKRKRKSRLLSVVSI